MEIPRITLPGLSRSLAPNPVGISAPGADPRAPLQALRDSIRAIERCPVILDAEGAGDRAASRQPGPHGWTLGVPALDALVGTDGLEAGAVHEIKPMAGRGSAADGVSDWAAACIRAQHFAMALGVRRLVTAPDARQGACILLCLGTAHVRELGLPYGPGLAGLGLAPERLIVVEAAKPAEVLWAIEEGLKSGGLALVLGQVAEIGLTPARRLALAAARTQTPCLLFTHPRTAAAAATATRWRIGPAPSAPHPLDRDAPGAVRFRVALERCRGSPVTARSVPSMLEWCNAAYRFRVASGLADGASRPRQAAGRPCDAVA